MLLLWIVGFSLLGSVGAIVLAGSFLLFPKKTRRILIPCPISYATGTLLGAAFLGLIPYALASIPPAPALNTVLTGVVLIFVLEKLVVWRHCRSDPQPSPLHRPWVESAAVGPHVDRDWDRCPVSPGSLRRSPDV